MKTLLVGLLGVVLLAVCIVANVGDFNKVPVEQKVVEIHMTTKETLADDLLNILGPINLRRAGTCSGEFIDDTGDILTARHCVDGFDEFEVQTFDRRKYVAVVVATSTSHDLALIHIDRRRTSFFVIADSATRGQKVFVLGSPLGITDTLSTGIIARIDGDVTLLDCSALPGNSGGPVFDEDQKLVGILNAGFIVGMGVTHLNKAQGLDAIHFFIEEATEKRYGLR